MLMLRMMRDTKIFFNPMRYMGLLAAVLFLTLSELTCSARFWFAAVSVVLAFMADVRRG